ncbi:hypothetical protein BRADI_2g31630v3, partial [Brachypodium distachyon]
SFAFERFVPPINGCGCAATDPPPFLLIGMTTAAAKCHKRRRHAVTLPPPPTIGLPSTSPRPAAGRPSTFPNRSLPPLLSWTATYQIPRKIEPSIHTTLPWNRNPGKKPSPTMLLLAFLVQFRRQKRLHQDPFELHYSREVESTLRQVTKL